MYYSLFREFLVSTRVRDETAMLLYKQWQNVAQVLHNNRIKFLKDFFRYCSVHRHGRRDVKCKSKIVGCTCVFSSFPPIIRKPKPMSPLLRYTVKFLASGLAGGGGRSGDAKFSTDLK